MSRYKYEDVVEWKVLLNGELWSDRFDSEEDCVLHIDECVEKGYGELNDFSYELMTDKDYERYK
jgi:hypothetical protein